MQLCYDKSHCISGSEDGTAKVWDIKTRKCQATLKHNIKSEVLRVGSVEELLCTCGSDGRAVLWQKDNSGTFSAIHEIDHGDNQIYACEVLQGFGAPLLVTAAEDSIHCWNSADNFSLLHSSSFEAESDGYFYFTCNLLMKSQAGLVECAILTTRRMYLM